LAASSLLRVLFRERRSWVECYDFPMARSIGTGHISFGLVSIPVKLYSTTDHSAAIRFNMLDAKDHKRVKQQYVNPDSGEVVERSQMVKGYEFAKGQFVTFTDQEVKELQEKASPTIDITEFVPLREVEPIFFDKTYFLGPEGGGERAYRLLAEAMRSTERTALARYAARGKQYLVMIRPYEEGLLMQQLYYADEIKDFGEVPLGEPKELKPGELELAVQLIEQIASDSFEPEKYADEVRTRIWAAIEQKVEGREVVELEEEAPKAQIIDLMEALKASLAAPGEGSKSRPQAASSSDESAEEESGGAKGKKRRRAAS
jgi:DNA end-binding protein Ku